jgi:hypothetical protein
VVASGPGPPAAISAAPALSPAAIRIRDSAPHDAIARPVSATAASEPFAQGTRTFRLAALSVFSNNAFLPDGTFFLLLRRDRQPHREWQWRDLGVPQRRNRASLCWRAAEMARLEEWRRYLRRRLRLSGPRLTPGRSPDQLLPASRESARRPEKQNYRTNPRSLQVLCYQSLNGRFATWSMGKGEGGRGNGTA